MRRSFRQFRFSRFLPSFVRRAVRDRRGVSAVAFAITFAVLAPMTLGLFDVYQSNEQHGKLQDALDAAALYAARSNAVDNTTINSIGNKALAANLQLIPGATLASSSFSLNSDSTKVQAVASVNMPAFAPMEYTHQPVSVNAEVTRNGNNLEVAIVLDNTGSMAGSPMTSLQSAANQLIDLVVSDTQTPFYSKAAIVPYSNAVNAGTYASAVRGAVRSATDTNCKNGANKLGCPSYTFKNMYGTNTTFAVSSCVSERTGTHAYDDASYTAGPVGWVYPPSNENHCIAASIQPLTSNKTALHNTISTLTADGSTAGHIGVAWGWYMVSPNWGALFPSDSRPVAYGTPNTIKAVVLMTDGAFNTAYCNGVISADSPSGSGSASNHINCNATNGNSFSQAQALCTAMKAAPNNIIIYTVGFLHGGADPQAQAILANCATDAAHAYLPTTGTDLQVAFQAIAADLNRLRISH